MTKKVKWFTGFAALALVMGTFCLIMEDIISSKAEISPVSVVKEEKETDVVIDAGHGGEDGGCIGLDGTLEKDLNLSVSKKIYHILNAAGINARLLRDGDTMVYDIYNDLQDYSGVKKTYDLKNRVRFAKESECRLFASIHMNKFSDGEYRGLQVYYSPNDSDSITAALRIQEHVKDYLQPENEREIKKAGSNIYVLHRSQMPAVLIECGFLSNENDMDMLKKEDYQKKLSVCIASAIADSLCNFET